MRLRAVVLTVGALSLAHSGLAAAPSPEFVALNGRRQDSLTLSRALTLARARSPRLQAAGAAVDEAGAQRAVATSRRLPHIVADATYLRFQDPPTFALGTLPPYAPISENNYLAQLRVEQPLFTSGRVASGVRAADWATRAAMASRLETEIELTAAVAHAFDDVLLSRALHEVAIQAVAVLEEAARVAQEHYAAGTVARLDVLRAETRLSSARSSLRTQEAALATAQERLAALIGIESDRLPPVAGALEVDPVDLAVDSLEERARRERPDIRSLDATTQALRAYADGARASRLPAVSAFVSVLGTSPELVTGESRFAFELLGGFSFTWALFDAGGSSAAARAYDAAATRATAQAAAISIEAIASLRIGAATLERSVADIHEGGQNVARAELALAIAQERYRDGIGIQLEVLEAEADLTRARGDLLRAIHAHRSAVIDVKLAIGLPADAPMADLQRGGR